MKVKKAAVKGLIILTCALALCVFFSGTIRTIATAKVKLIVPKQGKFSQTVELKGKLTFVQSSDVSVPGAADMSAEIKSVSVKPGQQVEKGDVIYSATLANYETTMAQYRQDYDSVEEQLIALERKDIRLRRTEQAWADAYNEYTDAREAYTDARLGYEAELRVNGLTELTSDAPDSLKAAYEAFTAASGVWEKSKGIMDSVSRYVISDEVRNYVVEKRKLDRQLNSAQEKMLDIQVFESRLREITAEEDGYIVDVYVKRGDTLTGGAPAYAFCPKKQYPVLRAPLEGVTLNVTKGMDATFKGRKDQELESEIKSIGWSGDATKYADVELDDDLIDDMGGTYTVSQSEITVKIEYRARQATSLLPTSAVRGGEDERYVYTVSMSAGAFGSSNMKVAKTSVTVQAEAGGMTSIEEDMSYQQIAYMEDRPIEDGATVMAYTD